MKRSSWLIFAGLFFMSIGAALINAETIGNKLHHFPSLTDEYRFELAKEIYLHSTTQEARPEQLKIYATQAYTAADIFIEASKTKIQGSKDFN